jgi:hypothetical protein
MVFIFAASAALAGYVGVKYGDPGAQQQAQPATPPARPVATSRPQPSAPPSAPSPSVATGAPAPSAPQAAVAPPPMQAGKTDREALPPRMLPSAAETRTPQQAPPSATSTMQLSGSSTAEPPRTTGARDAEAPKCNKDACANAYRSFDAADCTYQPSNGPRRACTKR